MYRRRLLAGVLAALCGAAAAETLSDPMRPRQRLTNPAPAQDKVPYDLSAILYSSDRRVAVINGRTVSEGDRIGSAKVRRIGRRSLELEERGERIRLVLAPARSGVSR